QRPELALKRIESVRVKLRDVERRMYFAVQHDERAKSRGVRCSGDGQRVEEIPSAVEADHRGREEGTGEDHGLSDLDDEVDEERGLLQRRRAVGDDNTGDALVG